MNFMDFLVISIRVPIALLLCVLIVLLFFFLFFLESAALLVVFPFAVIPMSREQIKKSWMGTFPNTLRSIPDALDELKAWVTK